MTFPEIVGLLMSAEFEGYAVDFRRGATTYYTIDGDLVDLDAAERRADVAAGFDISAVHSAIVEAQQLVPGYTYHRFCEKVMSAGCAGYMVSISGRRALYYGSTGETHNLANGISPAPDGVNKRRGLRKRRFAIPLPQVVWPHRQAPML